MTFADRKVVFGVDCIRASVASSSVLPQISLVLGLVGITLRPHEKHVLQQVSQALEFHWIFVSPHSNVQAGRRTLSFWVPDQ